MDIDIDTPPRPKRDCQCARARHRHGTLHAYNQDRCRCPECTDAAARSYKRRRVYGFDTRLDTRETRDHLAMLLAHPEITLAQVAEASGLTAPYLSELVRGKRSFVHTSTQRAILALTPGHCRERYLRPARPLVLRIQALCACGWSLRSIARNSGVNIETLRHILAEDHIARVTLVTDRRLRECYERLWDVPASHDPQSTLKTITRTMNHAARSGWKRPLDIDEVLQKLG